MTMSEDRRPKFEAGRPASDARTTDGFDRALESALRDMLDVEPPAGLRGRVLRRISGGRASSFGATLPSAGGAPVPSGFRRKILIVGAPLAAAAILILAVLLPRREEPRAASNTPTVARVEIPNTRVAEPLPTSPSAPTAAVRSQRTPRRPTARSERPVATYAYAPGAPVDTHIEPLTTITPIEVAPVGQRSLVTDEIAMRPLHPIADLSIAPLSPPERRN